MKNWIFRKLFAAECAELGRLKFMVDLIDRESRGELDGETCSRYTASSDRPSQVLFKVHRMRRGNEILTANLARVREELEAKRPRNPAPKPARFVLEGGLPEAEVAERLRGQARNGVVEAVQTLLDRKIVELSDRATSAPSAQMTQELRDYEAGGANALAEFKVQLEELVTAPLDPAPAAAAE